MASATSPAGTWAYRSYLNTADQRPFGAGLFTFGPRAEYTGEMRSLGYTEDLPVWRRFQLAVHLCRVASEACARRLVLTHISPRYFPGNETGPQQLLEEAREVFPSTELAHDFLSIDVERRVE